MSSERDRNVAEMAAGVARYLEAPIAAAFKTATKCCPNCNNFDVKKEICTANGNQRPPAHVIAFGCNWFEDNGVPF